MLTLNRKSRIKLFEEDLEWLLKQPRTLERDHVEDLLKWIISEDRNGRNPLRHDRTSEGGGM